MVVVQIVVKRAIATAVEEEVGLHASDRLVDPHAAAVEVDPVALTGGVG